MHLVFFSVVLQKPYPTIDRCWTCLLIRETKGLCLLFPAPLAISVGSRKSAVQRCAEFTRCQFAEVVACSFQTFCECQLTPQLVSKSWRYNTSFTTKYEIRFSEKSRLRKIALPDTSLNDWMPFVKESPKLSENIESILATIYRYYRSFALLFNGTVLRIDSDKSNMFNNFFAPVSTLPNIDITLPPFPPTVKRMRASPHCTWNP